MENLDTNEHFEGIHNCKDTPNDLVRIHERVNPILENKKTSYTIIQGNQVLITYPFRVQKDFKRAIVIKIATKEEINIYRKKGRKEIRIICFINQSS